MVLVPVLAETADLLEDFLLLSLLSPGRWHPLGDPVPWGGGAACRRRDAPAAPHRFPEHRLRGSHVGTVLSSLLSWKPLEGPRDRDSISQFDFEQGQGPHFDVSEPQKTPFHEARRTRPNPQQKWLSGRMVVQYLRGFARFERCRMRSQWMSRMMLRQKRDPETEPFKGAATVAHYQLYKHLPEPGDRPGSDLPRAGREHCRDPPEGPSGARGEPGRPPL